MCRASSRYQNFLDIPHKTDEDPCCQEIIILRREWFRDLCTILYIYKGRKNRALMLDGPEFQPGLFSDLGWLL